MNINEVADKLITYCRNAEWETAQKELYADNVVSLEPKGSPAERTEGLDAIIAKGKEFEKMVNKHHSITVSNPLIADRFISCTMIIDCDFVGMGRTTLSEICVFEVKEGKIVSEQFFYTPAPS